MAGGILNLISKGAQDTYFINNPTKTFLNVHTQNIPTLVNKNSGLIPKFMLI